jgi:Ca2+-binding EF-hand superfamily protein
VRWALEGDLQIARLRELRKSSGLGRVSVEVGLRRLRETAKKEKSEGEEEYHDVESLRKAMSEMIHPMPSMRVVEEIFEFFDFDGNQRIDALELIGGCALLCAGSEEDKLNAAFNVFDSDGDGYISMDEMFRFLSSVFRVVLSPSVVAAMRTLSVNVESAEDLAAATSVECFKSADLNDDGKLNIHEFKRWFNAPSRFPLFDAR